MNANEFIEKVRGLVLNNAELNKTAMEFFREHPECWSPSTCGMPTKLVGLKIGINFNTRDEQIKEARPWFSIDFGYTDAKLKHAEMMYEKYNEHGVYRCYVDGSDEAIMMDKVNW